MRILVVEDEKRLAQNLQELLRREGYTVDVSNDGVSGLDNALSGIYDLLVLDVMLPGLDGFALLQRLRSTGSRQPVLMLTARGELSDRVRGLDQGADYYQALSDAGAAGLRAPAAAAEQRRERRRRSHPSGRPGAGPGDVSGDLRPAQRPAQPQGVRFAGDAHAQRRADPVQGAAAAQGLGL